MASIKNGDKGPEVTLLQGVLKAMGYDVDIDGVFGDDTEAFVKKAQTDCGVESDGKVGPNTSMVLVGKMIVDVNMARMMAGPKA